MRFKFITFLYLLPILGICLPSRPLHSCENFRAISGSVNKFPEIELAKWAYLEERAVTNKAIRRWAETGDPSHLWSSDKLSVFHRSNIEQALKGRKVSSTREMRLQLVDQWVGVRTKEQKKQIVDRDSTQNILFPILHKHRDIEPKEAKSLKFKTAKGKIVISTRGVNKGVRWSNKKKFDKFGHPLLSKYGLQEFVPEWDLFTDAEIFKANGDRFLVLALSRLWNEHATAFAVISEKQQKVIAKFEFEDGHSPSLHRFGVSGNQGIMAWKYFHDIHIMTFDVKAETSNHVVVSEPNLSNSSGKPKTPRFLGPVISIPGEPLKLVSMKLKNDGIIYRLWNPHTNEFQNLGKVPMPGFDTNEPKVFHSPSSAPGWIFTEVKEGYWTKEIIGLPLTPGLPAAQHSIPLRYRKAREGVYDVAFFDHSQQSYAVTLDSEGVTIFNLAQEFPIKVLKLGHVYSHRKIVLEHTPEGNIIAHIHSTDSHRRHQHVVIPVQLVGSPTGQSMKD